MRHDDEMPNGTAVVAALDRLTRDERERRKRDREEILSRAAAEAENLLRRQNRGEVVEAVSAATEPIDNRPLRDVPDDELDLDSVPGMVEARRRGLLPARFCQAGEDYAANVAAFKAESYRAITGRQSSARPRCVTAARRPGRREARPGQHGRRARRHAATSLRDDGDDGPEPDAELAARLCVVVARLVRACELRMLATPTIAEADRVMLAREPGASALTRAAALTGLPPWDRAAIARSSQAEYDGRANREGGAS